MCVCVEKVGCLGNAQALRGVRGGGRAGEGGFFWMGNYLRMNFLW